MGLRGQWIGKKDLAAWDDSTTCVLLFYFRIAGWLGGSCVLDRGLCSIPPSPFLVLYPLFLYFFLLIFATVLSPRCCGGVRVIPSVVLTSTTPVPVVSKQHCSFCSRASLLVSPRDSTRPGFCRTRSVRAPERFND